VLTLRSPLTFKNETEETIALKLSVQPSGGAVTYAKSFLSIVRSGECCPIPLQFFVGGQIQIRPLRVDEKADIVADTMASASYRTSKRFQSDREEEDAKSNHQWCDVLDIEDALTQIRSDKAHSLKKREVTIMSQVVPGCHELCPALCRSVTSDEGDGEDGKQPASDGDVFEKDLLLSPSAKRIDRRTHFHTNDWNCYLGWEERETPILPQEGSRGA
jgi:hypothetical protein